MHYNTSIGIDFPQNIELGFLGLYVSFSSIDFTFDCYKFYKATIID